jgi:hypothetical protein
MLNGSCFAAGVWALGAAYGIAAVVLLRVLGL